MIAVYKNASETTIRWALVSEVEYDALCRPIVSVDYTAHSNNIPTKWTETHYSYTAFDHVEEISVYDENLTELSHKTYTYNFVTRIGTTDDLETHDVINDGATQKFTSVTVETDAKDGITPPTVTQFIDRRGRVVKQIRTDGTQEYISTYVYDATGNILKAKDEAAYKDYIVDYSEKYEYNYLNKVTRAYNAEGNFTETVYDNLGRTISQTDYMGNTTTYTYDSIGRMLTSSTPVDTMVTNLTRYYYDSNSNKIREICPMASGTVTYNYAYDSRNRLVSSFNGSTYTLNEYEGNQLIRTASGITNPENVEISELSPTDATYNVTLFNYNHLGFISSETTFVWAGDNIIREETTDKATDYFYGINRVSRTITGDAYTYNVTDSYYDESIDDYVETVTPVNGFHEYYAYDGRGNVVHTMVADIIDLYISPFYGFTPAFPEVDINGDNTINLSELNYASGSYPIWRNYYYSPFGEIWQGDVSSDTNPFRYRGEYLDNETGNIYLRARYYSPSTGRFITVDPVKDGTNWYVYCSNNPVMFVDPSGLFSIESLVNNLLETTLIVESIADDALSLSADIQRTFWQTGSDVLLRDYYGYETSAWMLEHSLTENPDDIYRGNNSRIAYLINNDSAYLSKLDKALKASTDGTINQDLKDIAFNQGDLYYSIHRATIHVEGHQQSDGSWIIHAILKDTYDFTGIQSCMDDNGWSLQASLGTIANDTAVISQLLGG